MTRYIIVSVVSGVLFGILDALINGNPLARKLYEVFKSLARTSFSPLAGLLIDLLYGFVMAAAFLLLYKSLPGETGLLRGASFALPDLVFPGRHVRRVPMVDVQVAVPGAALLARHRVGRDVKPWGAVWATLGEA